MIVLEGVGQDVSEELLKLLLFISIEAVSMEIDATELVKEGI